MSGAGLFRYALEPIRLTRQWALDALLVDLGDQNGRVANQEERIASLMAQLAGATAKWAALTDPAGQLQLPRLDLLHRYCADLAARLAEERAAMVALSTQRDLLAEKVMQSRRALDAVGKHRDEMQARFVRARTNGDFNAADEQWSILQEGNASDDH